MPGTFEIKGAKEMERLLLELGPKIANNLGTRAAGAGARVIANEAKRLVPKRTGQLRRSITVKQIRSKIMALIGFKPPVSRRAHFTEFGTSRAAAKPFVRPAMDSKSGEALRAMQEVLALGIAKAQYKQAVAEEVDFSDFD